MALQLSAAQVQGLAPDAAAVAAGKKLGKPGPWRGLAQSERALWGECQGSAVYQTQVALVDFASKCSCPSRKFPCKHALGLLFLAVDAPHSFASVAEPDWVSGWLVKRGAAQEKKQARVEAASSGAEANPVDEAAQAKRAAKRQQNVLGGLEQLDAWLNDLVRQGLARVQGEAPAFWEAQARRLIDAQAPGLAGRVQGLGELVGSSEAWAERLLAELGSLAWLSHAYRRLAELPPALAADVRRITGHTLTTAEVIDHGDLVEDEWTVLGEALDDEQRVRAQRVWLRGRESGRSALHLQFSVAGGRFAEALPLHTRFRARLAFWPSASAQRALIVERKTAAESAPEPPPGSGLLESLAGFADKLARNPWLERDLFVLERALVARGRDAATYCVAEEAGKALTLAGKDHDGLLALSGGHPITLVGEWDGYALSPLVAWQNARAVSVATRPQ